MSRTDGSLLPDDDFNELQAIADHFAEARKQGPIADWEPYLPPRETKLRRPALIECIKIDLEFAWKSGGGVRAEAYADRFPEFNGVPIEVIIEEYRIRHRFGDKPALDEFAARFPDHYAEFVKQVDKIVLERSAPKFAKTAAGPAPSLASLFPPGYKPGEFIGRGCFAEVWRAEAPGGIDIAIKIVTQPLDNDAAQREMQSLELVKKLQHPALLATTAFWIIENRLVIAMELADNSLLDRLKQCQSQGRKGIPADELLSYFRDAAEGLDWLHWQGVLHRDIKPENILLKKGYAKVGDFGLARAQVRPNAMTSVSFAGTPAFMAPEMWAGKASKHSDQYSLAFTYAELRMGRRPLKGDDFLQVMNSALEDEPDLEGLPAAEQTVLRRALSKRPEERFDSCVDFVEALERAVHPDGSSGRRRPRFEGGQRLAASDDASSTERTGRKLEKPKPLIDSRDQTVQQQSIPANKQSKWPRQAATAPPKANGAKLALVALLTLALAGGGAALAYMIFFAGSSNHTSKTEPTVAQTTQSLPEKTSKKEVIEPVKLWLPPRFVAHSDPAVISIGKKKYHARIVFRSGNAEAALRLLTPDGPKPSKPFYLMETKISNALFQACQGEMPGGDSKWKNEGPTLPAFNVTWEEADKCARWMGGRLPSPDELDFAAGFGKPGGLNRDPGAAAVKLIHPRPVTDTLDRSPLEIFDLVGNGREWTTTKFVHEGEDYAVLRGRNYRGSTPLTQQELESQQDPKNQQVQRIKVPSPYTSFRVVVDLPH